MANKKDLTGAIARGADLFFSANDKEQKPQTITREVTHSTPIEQPEKADALQTQGRKGYKLPKFNMRFTPSNMDYLRTMAGLNGMAVTHFANKIIEEHRAANAGRYEKAKELLRDE